MHLSCRELHNFPRHRGREEKRLTLPRDVCEDSIDLRLESHIEHSVCLIEHQNTHFLECNGPLPQMIIKAPGSSDENAWIHPKHLALQVHGSTSNERCDANEEEGCKRSECVIDLLGKLARRHNNKSPSLRSRKLLKHGETEGKGLTSACLCDTNKIFPLERRWNGLMLDRRRNRDVMLRKERGKSWIDPEGLKTRWLQ